MAMYPPDVRYQSLFLDLQRQAREAGRGLWATPTAQPAPAVAGNCHPSLTVKLSTGFVEGHGTMQVDSANAQELAARDWDDSARAHRRGDR